MKDSKTSPRKRPSPTRRKNKRPAPPLGKVKNIQPEDLSPYFDSPIDLLCIGSLEGIFQKLNPQWETTLGYPLSEMEGKDFIVFVHPDDRREALAAFREFGRQKGVRVLTNRIRCKDGSYRWLEWKYLLRGEHIFAAARDVTDRKRTEDELRESRRMLETVLNTIPARVFWKDRDLVYLGCNQSFAQDAGFRSPEEVIGKNDYQIGWADYTEEYQADDRAVIETGRAKIAYEESAINAEGKHFWVSTSKIPLRDPEGGIRGVLGT
ncbi:MAG: PAS domain-containing protein, partial [Anaerolineales bacterium]